MSDLAFAPEVVMSDLAYAPEIEMIDVDLMQSEDQLTGLCFAFESMLRL
jgi:hypothetical protein